MCPSAKLNREEQRWLKDRCEITSEGKLVLAFSIRWRKKGAREGERGEWQIVREREGEKERKREVPAKLTATPQSFFIFINFFIYFFIF